MTVYLVYIEEIWGDGITTTHAQKYFLKKESAENYKEELAAEFDVNNRADFKVCVNEINITVD